MHIKMLWTAETKKSSTLITKPYKLFYLLYIESSLTRQTIIISVYGKSPFTGLVKITASQMQ